MTKEEIKKLRKRTKEELIKRILKMEEKIERMEDNEYYNRINE